MGWFWFSTPKVCLAEQVSEKLVTAKCLSILAQSYTSSRDVATPPKAMARATCEMAGGAVAWWSAGAGTQLLLRAVGIAASHRFLASSAGFVGAVALGSCSSVFFAAAASQACAVSSFSATSAAAASVDMVDYLWAEVSGTLKALPGEMSRMASLIASTTRDSRWDTIEAVTGSSVCALAALYATGGRLWSFAPSDFRYVGAFSRYWMSLPAGEGYVNASQSAQIQAVGRRFGCHTCGSKGLFSSLRFHGDHQPPKFIASQLNQAWWRRLLQQPVLFRFYPQCETCSRQQGPLVKSGEKRLRTHITRLRLHRWLPGSIVVALFPAVSQGVLWTRRQQ